MSAAPQSEAVAVTGVGVLTPIGDNLVSFGESWRAGRRTIVDGEQVPGVGLSTIADFDAAQYAKVRGLRLYNRTTRLGICAAKLALADSGLEGSAASGEELGLVTGLTFGHIDTLFEYDRGLVTLGLRRTNPALMALSLASTPGAMIALAMGAKAFSTTLADGAASGLNALGLGARLVADRRARACLVVGAFAIHKEFVLAASRAGMIAAAPEFRVFDRRACGTALGEASAAVVLERVGDASARGARAKAIVHSHASAFASGAAGATEAALRRACDDALIFAGLSASDVSLVSAGANGIPADDRVEAGGIAGLLRDERPPVVAIKANVGETFDAGGLLQLFAAMVALRLREAPGIAGLEQPASPALRFALEPTPLGVGHALLTSINAWGTCAAVVASVPRDN
jgi:3-oxoacyl-(acyl-carrier-protein) synthase